MYWYSIKVSTSWIYSKQRHQRDHHRGQQLNTGTLKLICLLDSSWTVWQGKLPRNSTESGFQNFITPVYFHTLSLSHPPQPSFTPLTTTGYLPPPRHTIPPHPLSFGYLPSLPPHPHYAHHLKVDHFYSPDTILQAEEELWPYYTQAHFFFPPPAPKLIKNTFITFLTLCSKHKSLWAITQPPLHSPVQLLHILDIQGLLAELHIHIH